MSDMWNSAPSPAASDDFDDKVDAGDKAEDDDSATFDPTPLPEPIEREGALERAQAHGFKPRKDYNYEVYIAQAGGPGAAEGESARNNVPGYLEPSWAATAARYEWNDEHGDVAPRIPALEKALFRTENATKAGQLLASYDSFTANCDGAQVKPINKFEDAGLHPVILDNIELCGYQRVLPVQSFVIPAVLQGYDVIGIAQTGSGKTAAYLIPILSRLMGKADKLAAPRPNIFDPGYDPKIHKVRAEPLVLIVVPTRELAVQIFDETRRLAYRSKLRPCVIYGGGPTGSQREELQKGCDILVCTAGRLCDFMDKPELLSLKRVKYTVLDEADELVTPDWEPERKKFISGGDVNEDDDHIYLMFSATFSKEHRKMAREFLAEEHCRVRIGRAGSTLPNITQEVIYVPREQKQRALYDLLFSKPPARTIIFVNGRNEADRVEDFLFNMQLPSTAMHSGRSQLEREDAIRGFKSGSVPILVTTGVSARGLDIANVMHVINYDLPSTDHGGIDEYVHRIGRTGRIGHTGHATSFYNERNEDLAEDLVKILLEANQEIPDFLSRFKPEDPEALEFEDDTGSEDNEEDEGGAVGFEPAQEGFQPVAEDTGADALNWD
ncbi:ATP-dependent RNA helicase DED1 [Saccharata proteae CBS 121410]|uniref:RNA helicase n=1 Tax=Saccharata proteae CBS 121410 TaxID=1314787 RepID=A0A9P4I212_9PEZI|nr:ATP-dependent RNA helicase DED1 [Saccharata proteae CBS 121410]